MTSVNYLLHESAVGYGIFEVVHQADAIGLRLKEVQDSMADFSKFGKMVKLVNFSPWRNHAEGLQNINELSEGILTEYLTSVLELALPKTSGKKSKVVLGVADRKLAGEISSAFPGIECETTETSDVVAVLLRGVRQYAEKLLAGLQTGDVGRAQLGMSHAYSRSKVKFNIHKNDNHIIQQIATLDHLDKSINSGCMRVREWYGWHFPELLRIVPDNVTYAKLVLFIGNKESLVAGGGGDDAGAAGDAEAKVHELAALLGEDGARAEAVVAAAKVSMGQDISAADLAMVQAFARSVSALAAYRTHLAGSLERKMGAVAPNLQVILGTPVAARLISHAGSLTNLAKYPASTLQILGAEKALFRALKTKGNTPKYGLIYQSSFIGRSGARHRGRISRYLANKCSIAARVDSFSEVPTARYGEAMRQQLEDRLEFFASGKRPKTNVDAMAEAMAKVLSDEGGDEAMADAPVAVAEKTTTDKKEKKEKKEKKDKKDKKRKSLDAGAMDVDAPEKKKKKKVAA